MNVIMKVERSRTGAKKARRVNRDAFHLFENTGENFPPNGTSEITSWKARAYGIFARVVDRLT